MQKFTLKKLSNQSKWVLICGLVIAVVSFFVTLDRQKHLWYDELEQEVLENTLILGGKLGVIERELQGVLSLFNASTFVTREEFETFVIPILKNNTYIQSLILAPKVSSRDRDFYTQRMAVDGFSNFHITEQSEDGVLIEAGEREEYFPVHYVEPLKRNDVLFGFDLSSVPSLNKVLQESRDTGRIMATNIIHYLKENKTHQGIFVFAPFYESQTIPVTLEDRREKLNGFVVGFYRVSDMMNQMVKPYQARGINLVIFDGEVTDPRNRIYGDLLPRPMREFNNVINFSNRIWFLVWQGTRDFHSGPKMGYAWWIAVSIQMFAVFIAIIFEMMVSRTRQVENEVRLRTEELTRTNAKLKLEIEARNKVEKELHTAKEEAELANRAKSSFLAHMSHEIRTPMNAILGYSQILKRNRHLDARQKSNLDNILKSGDHLLQIINDILDISKIEAGKMELRPASFHLNELIENISIMIQPRCREKNIRWLVEKPAADFSPVYGDEIKLKQSLINLLSNAVKFIDSGQITLRVTAEANHRFLFEVIDTGKGIPKERQNGIFEPFHQESEGIKKGGTGLGLSIVKKQVELMGGRLTLDSKPGAGSRFCFTLHLPPADEKKKAASARNLKTRFFHLPQGVHIKALVADDNEQNRDVLGDILESAGLQVLTAANGKETVEMARKHTPDIIFMDLCMPVMDGLQALEVIKRELGPGTIKIVAISASALAHQQENTLKEGFDDFIPKPFHVANIFDCLAKLLGVHFIVAEEEPLSEKNQETGPLALTPVHLPEELLRRIREAANLSNLTDLKTCLAELRTHGEEGRILLERFRQLVGKYDMAGILSLLEKMNHAQKP